MKTKPWRAVVVFIAIVSLVSVMATAVSATGGPHQGTFTATTDACASCHRAHTGTAAKILRSSTQYALCTTCHGGTGADTNVVNGVYLGTTQGIQNAGLRGGGFEYAKLDTDLDGSVTSTAITSKHTVGGAGKAWGSGNISTTAYVGESMTLECGSCHNPHGNSQYRILRQQPLGLTNDAPTANVTIADPGSTENYTITYDSSNFTDTTVYALAVREKMADWCGQCHQRYVAGSGSASNNSTDAVFAFRHATDAPLGGYGECLACHMAHGTSANMTGNSSNSTLVIWPNSQSATWQDTGENDYSRLLRVDSRGICLRCHSSSDLTQN
jgi:predicted CXXCH cytochrome family protein